jgi:hypothetical protein
MRVRSVVRSAALIALIATAAVLTSGLIAYATEPVQGTPHAAAVTVTQAPTEDSAGWNCATMGNHICGPTNPESVPAGCYEDLEDEGTLVVAWTRYDRPQADPLWAQLNTSGHCLDIPGTHAAAGLSDVDAALANERMD